MEGKERLLPSLIGDHMAVITIKHLSENSTIAGIGAGRFKIEIPGLFSVLMPCAGEIGADDFAWWD